VLALGSPAQAGCHSYTVSAPDEVSEGNKVPVKITRDGAVNPSSIRVRTVPGSAVGNDDYTPVDRRVEFTSETSKVIVIQTTEDDVSEGSESFAVKLSDGQGCAVNPNFQYGPPEKITINDDDEATPVTTAPPATTAPAAAVTPTTAPESASPTATEATAPTLEPTGTPLALPISEESGFPWAPVGIGAGVVLVGAGALILLRMRRPA
jgi:hypothetical protein